MKHLLPAAMKLGQGNEFTGICLSTGGRTWPGPGGSEIFGGGLFPIFWGDLKFSGGSLIFGGVL